MKLLAIPMHTVLVLGYGAVPAHWSNTCYVISFDMMQASRIDGHLEFVYRRSWAAGQPPEEFAEVLHSLAVCDVTDVMCRRS